VLRCCHFINIIIITNIIIVITNIIIIIITNIIIITVHHVNVTYQNNEVLPLTLSGLSSRNLEPLDLLHDTLSGTLTEGRVSLAYWNYSS